MGPIVVSDTRLRTARTARSASTDRCRPGWWPRRIDTVYAPAIDGDPEDLRIRSRQVLAGEIKDG